MKSENAVEVPSSAPLHARNDIPTSHRNLRFVAPALLLGLGALFLLGYLPQQKRRTEVVYRAAARERVLAVAVTTPTRTKPEQQITLPGNIRGYEETVIYARADGYLARLHVDLGERVTEGQVLAELDIPEAAQELVEAQANVAQAEAAVLRSQAARDQSAASLRRYLKLAAGLTSREELDQKATQARLDETNVRVSEAALAAQRASLARLKVRQTFATVRAPFTGTITARTVERGSLVSAGRASPLFKLTALHTLRVFVQVPQARVAGMRTQLAAQVTVPEYPNRAFSGTVTRIADALDTASRTMTVEVQVPNPERKLLPGMYGSVNIALAGLAGNEGALGIPASASIVSEHGSHVAQVDAHGHVHMLPVVVERDRGTLIELANGLQGDEQIVSNPGPSLQEGSQVKVTQPLLTAAANSR